MQVFVNHSFSYKFRYETLKYDESSAKLVWTPSESIEEEEEMHGSCCHISREWLINHGSPAYKTGHVEVRGGEELGSQLPCSVAKQ